MDFNKTMINDLKTIHTKKNSIKMKTTNFLIITTVLLILIFSSFSCSPSPAQLIPPLVETKEVAGIKVTGFEKVEITGIKNKNKTIAQHSNVFSGGSSQINTTAEYVNNTYNISQCKNSSESSLKSLDDKIRTLDDYKLKFCVVVKNKKNKHLIVELEKLLIEMYELFENSPIEEKKEIAFRLGIDFKYGFFWKTTPKYESAEYWFEEAVRLGKKSALVELGWINLYIFKQEDKGLSQLKQAARSSIPEAFFKLGLWYLKKHKNENNIRIAEAWFANGLMGCSLNPVLIEEPWVERGLRFSVENPDLIINGKDLKSCNNSNIEDLADLYANSMVFPSEKLKEKDTKDRYLEVAISLYEKYLYRINDCFKVAYANLRTRSKDVQTRIEGIKTLKIMSDRNNMTAKYFLGKEIMYNKSKYNDGNYNYLNYNKKSALDFLYAAAENGINDADYYLGIGYQYGDFGEVDIRKAINWHLRAAKKNDSYALVQLSIIGSWGYAKFEDVRQYMLKAAELGNSLAYYYLGEWNYLGDNGFMADKKISHHYYQNAADANDFDAQLQVAKNYFLGDGIEKDIRKAKFWFCRASINDHTKVTEFLNKNKLDFPISGVCELNEHSKSY